MTGVPNASSAGPTCADCGSADVNWRKSWNEAGQWTCDACWPDDPDEDDEDWL